MAIGSAMYLRRLVRTGLSGFVGMMCLCGLAAAQTPVTSGSPIPTTHPTWGQVTKVIVAKNGSTVFLDWSTSGLYQLRPGASTFTTIASGAPLEASGTYWNSGMTIDAKDTLYIADRYGATHFFRIPYNPVDGTWDFTTANAWGGTIGNGTVSLNTFDLAFIDSAAKDGSGTLVVATETSPSIYTVPVDNQGNWGSVTIIATALKSKAAHIAADVNGNIYFLEDNGVLPSARVTGIFFIPAGKSGILGDGKGAAEAQMTRIDPPSNNADYSGITLDAAGNIYLSSQSDSNGGAYNGTLVVPNTSGTPLNVTAGSFNFNQATFLTPVQSSAPLAIDPRGYLWIPTSTSGWTPPGSLAYPGTNNVVLWQVGSANLGASPVGKTGAPGTVFFNFSQSVTPAKITFSEPGTGSDFVPSATNPIADPNATTPQLPCTAGLQYNAYTTCPYWISLNPRRPGNISGEVMMLDASNKVIAQSNTYLTGIGQGPDISLMVPASQTPLATGLSSPQQVAADSLGNSYLADSGQGKVLMFAAGAASASAGTAIGSGFTAPTGVAVDGSGDLFVADSGKVYKIPFANGALNVAGQTTIASGLGTKLRLAADGVGNVYVTDPDNSRVVKIPNPLTSTVVSSIVPIGSGYSKPSAIAVDNLGNVFVADGTTLSEIAYPFYGPPVAITNNLVSPVTGLAVDPSGSIDVAQTGGILHIPSVAGVLSANSGVAIDTAITAPNGLGIDSLGNLYVSDLTSGKNLYLVGLNASVNFGQISPFVPSNPVDVDVFNIGNLPLSIKPNPTFTGPMAVEFSTTAATQNGCDTTGATPVAPGSSCIIDVQITAADIGARTGTMNVTSNAGNAATVTAALTGTGVNNLERSKVVLAVTPATGVSYPGSATATITVTPTVTTTTPTGQVVVVLINQNASLHQTTTLPAGSLTNGVATFNLKAILGGTYTVQATYYGDTKFSGGRVTATLTVAQATPTVSLTQPSNITPVLGTYYVPIGSNTALMASVASTTGNPTGNISFLNGTQVADPTQNPVALNANGNATFSTQNLPAGTYTLTAVYNGDQNFANVTSSVITFQVIPKSIIITSTPPSLTITAGTPVQAVLTLQSLVGFSAVNSTGGGVFIACDNTTLPKYSECTFDVPQIQISANGASTTTLTISSNLPVNVGRLSEPQSPIAFAGILALGLFGLAFRKRTKQYRAAVDMACLLLFLTGSILGVSGCTNSSYTTTPPAPHVITPSGSYNVRIYATDPKTGAVNTLPFTLPVTVK